jgi:hypothetical protein
MSSVTVSVTSHASARAQLTEQNVPKKNFPKKPQKPRKPKFPEAQEGNLDQDDEAEGEDNGGEE